MELVWDEILFSPWALLVAVFLLAEVLHHVWSIANVKALDRLYAEAKLDRDVDIIEEPHWREFQTYWRDCDVAFRAELRKWAKDVGQDLDQALEDCKTKHISEDSAQAVDPWGCVPMTHWFRTFNSIKLFITARRLRALGFRSIYGTHCQLHYYTSGNTNERELLVIFPQFSGEFGMLSVFHELKEQYDILFVCPRSTQFSWSYNPGRFADALAEYVSIVLKYDKIVVLTWSAGNTHFQALDRYLELKQERHRVRLLIRLDPLGYPSSNFFVFTAIPLSWRKMRDKLMHAGRNGDPRPLSWINLLGTYGFSWLLKSAHGYVYVKLGRMLRGTKLVQAPYDEHHFTASFDPCWQKNHFVFENDRKILCKNVTEHIMDGFHGLWLSHDLIRSRVFPLLTSETKVH